jgi:DNA polymerase-1
MDLPVLQTTTTGSAATGGKVIKRLLDHPKAEVKLLKAIIDLSKVDKLLTGFLPAFKALPIQRQGSGDLNGTWWLNGDLKTTGTQSGRLSSSNINMQNLPATKLVKSCFRAPEGYLFCFADFSSLEAKINALLTDDPNKKKVYTQGYDSHSLAAYAYFSEQMLDIDPGSVESINSIADKYSDLRSASKPVTFASQYGGTWKTLVNNLGFSEEQAKDIEQRYLDMFEVSTIYAETLKRKAMKQGYIDLAFGLKLRTPVLAKTVPNSKLSAKAAAEGRSVYNADSQSYGLLMNRALIELDKRLAKESDAFQDCILPLNTIHDAGYFLVKNEPEYVHWLNENLIDCMTWQDLPNIRSKDIIIGAELDVGLSWDSCKTLHNKASLEEVTQFLKDLHDEN